MEKEIITVEKREPIEKSAELIAIKGRLLDATPLVKQPVYLLLQNFLRTKQVETYSLRLPLDKSVNIIVKRSWDILFSTIFILGLLSWLIPLIALAIKIDSRGPVFFLQKRNKRNGGIFTCIKFRSMIVNEEADISPATVDDIRITRLGKFLRNHFLDELPQFFNVWWGDMSLIGPRPHMIHDNIKYEELIEYYDYRHKAKPGITGLAQVLGYVGEITNINRMRDRVQLDIYYIRHWSLKTDARIFFRTFLRVLGL